MNKRIYLHVAFWLAYLVQDAMLEFLWVGPAIQQVPENLRIIMAIKAALALWIPKLLFTYFILYVSVGRILAGKVKVYVLVLEITVALFITILLYRLLLNYYIYPKVYNNLLKGGPIFSMQRILRAVMDIGFVTGGAVAIKLVRIQLEARVREKNLVQEKLETELKFLRNQTNPHFLFNTLNNIYALARKKSDDTPEAVMKLSKLLRFMLYESKKEFIAIAEELKMLDDYLELERFRYNERLSIAFTKSIDDGTQPVAPLLLLPFVENAFKHGVSESRFDSFVHIDIALKQGYLTFKIENTKENGHVENVTDNIGLGNVRRQLQLMYKDYRMDVQNSAALFTVHLTINLNSYAKI
ncbi:MAG: sensor histidine kinase [Chitinophagaceae bacterium]